MKPAKGRAGYSGQKSSRFSILRFFSWVRGNTSAAEIGAFGAGATAVGGTPDVVACSGASLCEEGG